MSSDVAISVSDLSKCYQIYDRPQDRLLQMLSRNKKQYYREFRALSGVSFEVKKGETVGIVGRNGAGKSTLLQIICGTLAPSEGAAEVSGRIAALLELGSGFNPEFTGRENVFFNASILGLEEEETAKRFDGIAAFADIGEFIDQPVSTYSSGMVVRLAFAVAINVNPEILIIDEALSVGDELFQRKCFSRIEAMKKAGATILFVSHSGGAIIELCDKAILLDKGEQLAFGIPKYIVAQYQKMLFAPKDKQNSIRDSIRLNEISENPGCEVENDFSHERRLQAAKEERHQVVNELLETFDLGLKPPSMIEYESHGAYIGTPKILTLAGEQVNGLIRGRQYKYCYVVNFDRYSTQVRFGAVIRTTSGFSLGGMLSAPAYMTQSRLLSPVSLYR